MSTRLLVTTLLLTLLLSLPLWCLAASPPLILKNNTPSVPLAGHLDILDDKDAKLTIDEVSSPAMASQFRPVREAPPRKGFRRGVYWLRFTIAPEGQTAQDRLLELDLTTSRYLDLYLPKEGGGFDLMQSGTSRPMSVRRFPHRNPVFPLAIDGREKTFYLRIDGPRRALPFTIWSHEAFSIMDSHRNLINGGYFGAMLVMIAYNLFIFLSLRDRSYLWYILDIFCVALVVFYQKGHLFEFVTAQTPSVNRYAYLLAAPSILASLAFCRTFLATARTVPVIDRFLTISMIVTALCIPAATIVPAQIMVQTITALSPLLSFLILSAAVVCFRRGFRPARYFISARIFRIMGTFSVILAMNNVLPWNLLTLYGMQIGSLCEVLLLSFALADRISVMRADKEQAQAEAIRASHLAALGELAAGVAHEINTPVNTIINSADLLLEEESDRTTIAHDAGVIKDQGRRIATIVKSLLFFSRKPEQEKEPFAVTTLLQGTLDMIGARLRKENVQITVQSHPGLAEVLVHPQQIEQVFLNILINALHALDERHGESRDAKTLDIVASEIVVDNRAFVRIAFRDNGIGIKASLLDTVKDAFVTTRKSGTGLGLSISRQIIDEHGGALVIESTEQEYTLVRVDLPAVT
jgi:signal transduction histidine kinase